MSVERALICPPSRRGHSWRELTPAERIELLFTRSLEGCQAALEVRICKRCGRHGTVTPMGLISLVLPGRAA